MKLQRPLLFVVLVIGLSAALATPVDPLQRQRADFVAAERSLEQGAMDTFAALRDTLRDYPLRPYLDFQALLKRLHTASTSEVADFLQAQADTPLAWQLRAQWLNQLARQQRWRDYLSFYRPTSDVTRRCYQLQALMATGKTAEAMSLVAPIWLHGKSQPDACDPAFAAWTRAGLRTDEMIWQRIELAMQAGQLRLARYLGRSLPKAGRSWVDRWIRLYQDPQRVDLQQAFADPHPYREVMLTQAIRRLARRDGAAAMRSWQQLRPRHAFTAAQISDIEHYIVRNLVREAGEDAYAFIRQVDVAGGEAQVHHARIRAALLREDWAQVSAWIGALPAAERDKDVWLYWHARALEATGDHAAAGALYARAAQERTYYGFMAADRADLDYHLDHNETPVLPALLLEVDSLPAVHRARELLLLERWTDARREWQMLTGGMEKDQLKAAATLAKRQGWHDRAIFTLARTGYWDDLELRFPLEHADLIGRNARLHDIDDAWIFAVLRQESAFMNDARSHAGAMGLMQLMPATARSVARKVLKQAPPRGQQIYQADTNIALGSAYLKQMKEQLGDSAILATAAYNAGPRRVSEWLPERTLPADIWIELVPFHETRGYLRRVLAYTVIYEKRMGRTPTRLRERLHPVPPDIRLLDRTEAIAQLESAD